MKQNNIKIAVTGGIGSGKTTVCNFIKELGFNVYSCDEIYAELLNGGMLTDEISSAFGNEILTDSKIDRQKLGQCVFNDGSKLKKLNEITHKAIFNEMFKRAENVSGPAFFEVPLLFEGGYENLFDGVIVVLRDEDARINSVVLRDNLVAEDVKKRIACQYNYSFDGFAEYYVIHNCGTINNLFQKIKDILLKITDKNCG